MIGPLTSDGGQIKYKDVFISRLAQTPGRTLPNPVSGLAGATDEQARVDTGDFKRPLPAQIDIGIEQ